VVLTEPCEHLLAASARLVIRVGVNVKPGRDVVVTCRPEQADVARALAHEAYRVGASRVTITDEDLHLQRSAVLHAPAEMLAGHRRTCSRGSGPGERAARRSSG
jgi:aminopeptidase